MKVKATLLPVLVLAGACAFAQQPADSTPNSNSGPATEQQPAQTAPAQAQPAPSPNDAAGNTTTIHGCLGTGGNGAYTVTEDKTGMVYTLTGKDFSSLSSHVGQEVEADGQPSAAASGSTDKTTATAVNAFQVVHMRKVGDHCTSTKSPSSSLSTASPVLIAAAFAPQTAGSSSSTQPGNSGPAANGSTGMSTSPQTSTPGAASPTPSTATPAAPAQTTPGTSTTTPSTTNPGQAATPGASGSSSSNSTAGSQAPCAATGSGTAANGQAPCSTPTPNPQATPGTATPDGTTATPGAAAPEATPPTTTTTPGDPTTTPSSAPPK